MRKNRIFTIFFVLIIITFSNFSQASSRIDKALWAPAWNINTPEKVKDIVTLAYCYDFDKIFAEIRYRGDALYTPNKNNKTYINPEKKSYFLSENTIEFDPLEYMLSLAHILNIKVYAWLTTFVVTPKSTYKLPDSHLFFQHPEWITYNYQSVAMKPSDVGEGLFLDPGILEVKQYNHNILGDVISNYNIDGIVLDYIRYPGPEYGYNPIAIKNYNKYLISHPDSTDFSSWRKKQINDYILNTSKFVYELDPEIDFAVTAWCNYKKANNEFFQDWKHWLNYDLLDTIYLMAYIKSEYIYETTLRKNLSGIMSEKIAISLGSWGNKFRYPQNQVLAKINITKKFNINKISVFNFNEIKVDYLLTKSKTDNTKK